MADVTLELKYKLPTNNQLIRMHWAEYKRLAQDLKLLMHLEVRNLHSDVRKRFPFKRAQVCITRIGPSRVDPDNVSGSVKPIIDLLRPYKHVSGVYKKGPKKGQAFTRDQGCFGIILEDSQDHIELVVKVERGEIDLIRVEISELPTDIDVGAGAPTKEADMAKGKGKTSKGGKVVNLPGKHSNGGKAKGGEMIHDKTGTSKGPKKAK